MLNQSENSKDKSPSTKKCPFCAEEILSEARKCKHCSEFLDGKKLHDLPPGAAIQESVVPTVLSPTPTGETGGLRGFTGFKYAKGRLKTLGKGTWIGNRKGSQSSERYSIVEIADTKYRNVYIPDHIATYLDKAINDDVEVLMGNFLFRLTMVGVRTRQSSEVNFSPIYVSILCSILFIPFWGIGLFFLCLNIVRIKSMLALKRTRHFG